MFRRSHLLLGQDGETKGHGEETALSPVGDAAAHGTHDVLADGQPVAAVGCGGLYGLAENGVALLQHQISLGGRDGENHGLFRGAVLGDVGANVVDQAHQQSDIGPHPEGLGDEASVLQPEAVAGQEAGDVGDHLPQQLLPVVGIQRQGAAILLEGEEVIGETADVVGLFQRPVDEQLGALLTACVALGEKLQIADDHRQGRPDIVGDGFDELLLLFELGVLRQQQQLDGVPQMVDVGRQRGQLRFVADGDLLAEILVAQGGDVLLHLTDVPDVLLEEKEEGRHEGSYEQHTADGLSQGGIGLIEIAAEIDLAGLVLQLQLVLIGGENLGAPEEGLAVLLGVGHIVGDEGVVAQAFILSDDHEGDIVVFVVPLGEGLAVGADNMVFRGKILEVCKMLVGQALEHLRLHGVVLEKSLEGPVGGGVHHGADGGGQQDPQQDAGAEPVKQFIQCSSPLATG